MTSWRGWFVVAELVAVAMLVGCGGSEEGQGRTDLTGTWDMIDLNTGSVVPAEMMQAGNDLTGHIESFASIAGVLDGDTVLMTVTIFTNPVYFAGTLSADAGNIAGSYADTSGDGGTFSMSLRGTGEGVDMTGPWLSQDLETSVGAQMNVTQNGSTLTGIVQGPAATAVMGTISGPEVTFTYVAGTNRTVWMGYLSVDGNTVTGNWSVEGQDIEHGWRMLRQ